MAKILLEGKVQNTQLADALSDRYLSYALSTIVSRSLPDVRDGLKPVHRRLLYAMSQLKLNPGSGFKKCARVVGDVIGKYHPHGDGSVYDALVRLAQDFSQRYPLVDGQGNFGNIDGDNAAAMRYTESRLTNIAQSLLEGINENTVDFRNTYDGEDEEPIVLPSKIPHLLANGASGIAVGMATSIPPHNLDELCKALQHLIKFPNATTIKLVDFIKGPDFPTGGILIESKESIVNAYKTGRGGFLLRAKWEKENLKNGMYKIVITEIPYQVQKSRLIEKTAELLLGKKLPLLADILDESAENVRIVLEPKNRNTDPEILMEHLYKQTELETRIPLNMNVINKNNTPNVMGLRDCLQAFLDHRHEILIRRSNFKLEKIERRLEILEGLLIAFLNLDAIINIIREEDNPKKSLIKEFELSDIQAEAVLNMRLRQLHKLEEIEIQRENEILSREKDTIANLLSNKTIQWKTISTEIEEVKKEFGAKTELGARRTKLGLPPPPINIPVEAIIEKEPITIVASKKDWIRTIRGHNIKTNDLKFKEGDACNFFLFAETTDKLIIFATNGRFYTISCDKLPGGRGHGDPLRLIIDLENGHEIIDMFIFKGNRSFLISSDTGRGFRINEKDVIAQTKTGKQILNLKAKEKAAIIHAIGEYHDHVAVINSKRKLLIFSINELPTMNRGKGVILQKCASGIVSSLTTLKLSEGLTWKTTTGVRTEKNISNWVRKRAQSGQIIFKGFPRSNKF